MKILAKLFGFLSAYGFFSMGLVLTVIGILNFLHILNDTGKHSGIASTLIGLFILIYSIFVRKDLFSEKKH
ncbi:MAG TPA: hypothetical protein PLU27_13970 [Ginsengibacter sp.]|nr:hypothetical protein [Ginsengibacter sp.]